LLDSLLQEKIKKDNKRLGELVIKIYENVKSKDKNNLIS